ncbi:hypothetical protein DDQ50_10370 [Amnibacterium flavum]|uniref:Uncharacterized protein n=2 Tax=Amnibacterium flavum TaxID=2173173 RepID=A0A2V1HVH4_9MICO|nr:hypothetical protein DDQ50_10370 [Amnibacterium flavum]
MSEPFLPVDRQRPVETEGDVENPELPDVLPGGPEYDGPDAPTLDEEIANEPHAPAFRTPEAGERLSEDELLADLGDA